MEDIPQTADEPYSRGDKMRVYTGPDDPDSRHHSVHFGVLLVL
jgi:hypothetical protein